jgi:C1A family cysteine protease
MVARISVLGLVLAILLPVNLAFARDIEPVPLAEPQIAPDNPRQYEEPPPGMGFIPPPGDFSHLNAPMAGRYLALPARFDWREAGKVSPVKNQGSCGSCYAFAYAGCFEAKVLVDGAGLFDFSENNIKECNYFGSSCSGSNDWNVTNFLSTKGTVLEACDPYVASNVDCNSTCSYQKAVLDWRAISGMTPPPVDVLKSYIQTYGPVYTAMYAGSGDPWRSEFGAYDGSYTLYKTGPEMPNHAVLIVGWDDNLAHQGGTGAWIVKNSWGTSWGGTCGYGTERGYFKIAYGSAQIGAYASVICAWQDCDPDGGLLYYDDAGYTGSVGYGSKTIWGLCKFVPSKDWTLKRVEFWTLDATTDVDVYIYDNFSGGAVSNLLASDLDNSFPTAGYHSVELAAPLHLVTDHDVYAVVKITNATSLFPLVFDSMGPKSLGYSYISPNGASYTQFSNGDLGIRLRVAKSLACGNIGQAPVITTIVDVPDDHGGQVNLTWSRSSFDSEGSSPKVRTYRVWRKRLDAPPGGLLLGAGSGPRANGQYEVGPSGLAWEMIATVPATGACCYQLVAATNGDVNGSDTCWTYFYITAHTGVARDHFDSPTARGFSVDNSGVSTPPEDPGDQIVPDDPLTAGTGLRMPEPNPSAQGFLVRFALGTSEWTSLAVYDVGGRRIAVLREGLLEAGPHTARWDPGSDGAPRPAPGVYFARLATAAEVHTVKLVLAQ